MGRRGAGKYNQCDQVKYECVYNIIQSLKSSVLLQSPPHLDKCCIVNVLTWKHDINVSRSFGIFFSPVMLEQSVSLLTSCLLERRRFTVREVGGFFILSILVCPAESFNQLLGVIIIIIFCLHKSSKNQKNYKSKK